MANNNVCQYLSIRWENHTKNRYYELRVSKDLFDWTVIKIWGRINSSRGQMTSQPCKSFEEGIERAKAVNRLRLRRGYQRISLQANDDTLATFDT